MISDPADTDEGEATAASTDSETLLERLSAGDVLEVDDRGTVRLDEAFTDRIDARRREIAGADDADLREVLRDASVEDDAIEGLIEAAALDEEFLAEYLALDRVDGLSHEARLRTLSLFDALRHAPPDAGAPEPFVPVRGVRLPLLLPLYELAIVYTWREDCPPCETMKEGFEATFEEPPADIALFSVYGPDWGELLEERYDVVGGPTTLFFHEGRVDVRLTGAHATPIVRREVEKLRDVAAGDR